MPRYLLPFFTCFVSILCILVSCCTHSSVEQWATGLNTALGAAVSSVPCVSFAWNTPPLHALPSPQHSQHQMKSSSTRSSFPWANMAGCHIGKCAHLNWRLNPVISVMGLNVALCHSGLIIILSESENTQALSGVYLMGPLRWSVKMTGDLYQEEKDMGNEQGSTVWARQRLKYCRRLSSSSGWPGKTDPWRLKYWEWPCGLMSGLDFPLTDE